MVGVELSHEVVALITVVIVEEGEIAFLAARAPRPDGPVIVGSALARRNKNAVLQAPAQCLRGRVLVGKPGVMRNVLGEHRL